MRFIKVLGTALLFSLAAFAQTPDLENLYTNPQGKTQPEAIIFYNSVNPCENCEKAVEMLETVLKENYQGKMHAYLIDAAKHPEFIGAFNLSGPLTLVIIRISDGAAFGYKKLTGLQSRIGEPAAFNTRIKEFIDNFLGF